MIVKGQEALARSNQSAIDSVPKKEKKSLALTQSGNNTTADETHHATPMDCGDQALTWRMASEPSASPETRANASNQRRFSSAVWTSK